MASGGYPDKYKNGYQIEGIDKLSNLENVEVFHSATKNINHKIVTDGGRVLSITARSSSLKEARKKVYKIVEKIKWTNEYHRDDIAKIKN